MRIDYPTDAERDASIDAILAAGLDPQPALRHALGGLYRILGLRGMLFGVWDCVLLAVLLSGCAAVPLMSVLLSRAEPRLLLYPLTGGAPLLYAALLLLTFWKEEQLGTRELKMTVLYDLRQLTALRLLLFSGMAALGNVLLAACAAAFSQLSPSCISPFLVMLHSMRNSSNLCRMKRRTPKPGRSLIPARLRPAPALSRKKPFPACYGYGPLGST